MSHEPLPLRLGVNVDHVATVRQARGTHYPSPLTAALVAQAAGGDSITVHLREDRRHIQERDVQDMLSSLSVPLNLELAASEDMLAFATAMAPQACCLVPERREELTTEGGLDLTADPQRFRAAVQQLKAAGARVSLFLEPDLGLLEAIADCAPDAVEIHTGAYAGTQDPAAQKDLLGQIAEFAAAIHDAGMEVHAGHGLTINHVSDMAAIPQIVELNIGHSIVADAVLMGMAAAVARMKNSMVQARLSAARHRAQAYSAI